MAPASWAASPCRMPSPPATHLRAPGHRHRQPLICPRVHCCHRRPSAARACPSLRQSARYRHSPATHAHCPPLLPHIPPQRTPIAAGALGQTARRPPTAVRAHESAARAAARACAVSPPTVRSPANQRQARAGGQLCRGPHASNDGGRENGPRPPEMGVARTLGLSRPQRARTWARIGATGVARCGGAGRSGPERIQRSDPVGGPNPRRTATSRSATVDNAGCTDFRPPPSSVGPTPARWSGRPPSPDLTTICPIPVVDPKEEREREKERKRDKER